MLPIPDIMESASKVIDLAGKAVRSGANCDTHDLAEALKKIKPSDIMDVMNEVGNMYLAIRNPKINGIGSGFSVESNAVVLGISMQIGPMKINIPAPFTAEEARALVKGINAAIDGLNPHRIMLPGEA